MNAFFNYLRVLLPLLVADELAAVVEDEEVAHVTSFSVEIQVHGCAERACGVLGDVFMLFDVDFAQGWHDDESVRDCCASLRYVDGLLDLLGVVEHGAVIAAPVIPGHLHKSEERQLTIIVAAGVIMQTHVRDQCVGVDAEYAETVGHFLEKRQAGLHNLAANAIFAKAWFVDAAAKLVGEEGAVDAAVAHLQLDVSQVVLAAKGFVEVKQHSHIGEIAESSGCSLQVQAFVFARVCQQHLSRMLNFSLSKSIHEVDRMPIAVGLSLETAQALAKQQFVVVGQRFKGDDAVADVASAVNWLGHPLVACDFDEFSAEDAVFVSDAEMLPLQHLCDVEFEVVDVRLYHPPPPEFLQEMVFVHEESFFECILVAEEEVVVALGLVDGQYLVVCAEGGAGEPVELLEVDQFDEHIAHVLHLHVLIHLLDAVHVLVLPVARHQQLAHLRKGLLQQPRLPPREDHPVLKYALASLSFLVKQHHLCVLVVVAVLHSQLLMNHCIEWLFEQMIKPGEVLREDIARQFHRESAMLDEQRDAQQLVDLQDVLAFVLGQAHSLSHFRAQPVVGRNAVNHSHFELTPAADVDEVSGHHSLDHPYAFQLNASQYPQYLGRACMLLRRYRQFA